MNLDVGNDVAVCIFVRNKGNRNISEVEIVAAEGVENAGDCGHGTGSIEGLTPRVMEIPQFFRSAEF